ESFRKNNQLSIDSILKPLSEQITSFQKRVNEVHSEAIKGNASLETQIKNVVAIGNLMSNDAKNLSTALKGNNKILGNWGETQLETSLQLAGLIKNEHYLTQEQFRDELNNRLIPDFVVKLPDNKHIIIDAKTSLVAYERSITSEGEEARVALKEHIKSLKDHIDGLSKKDYSSLTGLKSPDFVLMFIPVEAAYIEAMKFDTELFNYAYKKKVIMVSHTTLMPILRTVANIWRIERSNSEVAMISKKAGEIYDNVCTLAEEMLKLGRNLNTASKQYNTMVTKLVGNRGLYGKVSKFKEVANVSKSMPDFVESEADFEIARLENLVENSNPKNDKDLLESEILADESLLENQISYENEKLLDDEVLLSSSNLYDKQNLAEDEKGYEKFLEFDEDDFEKNSD
nr:DNA recombination protein RmuC [Campylobacter sp.]